VVWLRLLHIVAGAVWVGAAVYIALFVLPAARAAGAEGGRFLDSLMRRTGPALGVAMLLTVVTGFAMYGRLSAGFNRAWVTSRPGLALAAGAAAALLAVIIGVGVNGRAGRKSGALRKTLASQGGAPPAALAAELATLQSRMELGARVTAALLVLAAAAMATARYL
jgi:uncharacterized membrane protein